MAEGSNVYTVMIESFALIVGIDKYDAGDNFTREGPCHSAISIATWLTAVGTPGGNIFLFLAPSEVQAFEDERKKLQDLGVHIEWSGTLDSINTFCRSKLSELEGSNARFMFYWCGHGYTGRDGSRLFLCSDYADRDLRKDKVFNATAFINFLRSPEFRFGEQIFLADVCATRDEYLWQYAPGFPMPKEVSAARQVWIFATTEDRYSTGFFTTVVLRRLRGYDTWPALGQFVTRILSALRESGGSPFLGVQGFSRESDVSIFLAPTFADAEAMVHRGTLLPAIEALIGLYRDLSQKDTGRWQRLAYQILRRVSSEPAQSVLFVEQPKSLAFSEDEWFLAIGTKEGSGYVKRSRNVANHALTLQGELCEVTKSSTSSSMATVNFRVSGAYFPTLEIRNGAEQYTEVDLFVEGKQLYRIRSTSNDLVASADHGMINIQLTSGGQLTVERSGNRKITNLPVTNEADRFLGLAAIGGEGILDRNRLWIACLTGLGHIYVVDENGAMQTGILPLHPGHWRLYAVSNHKAFVVETEKQIYILSVWSAPGLFSLQMVAGDETKTIKSSTLLYSDKHLNVVLGYTDGCVQICRSSHVPSTEIGTTLFQLHQNAVEEIFPFPGYAGFYSVSKESVAIVRNPIRGADHVYLPLGAEITAASVAKNGNHLVTGHRDGRLMLWTIEPMDQTWKPLDDVPLRNQDARALMLNGDFCIRQKRLWITGQTTVFRVSRSGIEAGSKPPECNWESGRFCWSPTGQSVLILRTSAEADDHLHTYEAVPLTVAHLHTDGRVTSHKIDIGSRRPTAYAANPAKDAYYVGFADGGVIEVRFDETGKFQYRVREILGQRPITSIEKPSAQWFMPHMLAKPWDNPITWLTCSHDGMYLAISLTPNAPGARNVLLLINLSTLGADMLESFGAENLVLTEPACFAAKENVLFAATEDGGVASLTIEHESIKILDRYAPDKRMLSPLQFLCLATDGSWLAGAAGRSISIWKTNVPEEPSLYAVSESFIRYLCAVPGSDRLVSIDGNGDCVSWDATTGQRVADIAEKCLWHNDIAISADGSMVSVLLEKNGRACVFPLYNSAVTLLERLNALASLA